MATMSEGGLASRTDDSGRRNWLAGFMRGPTAIIAALFLSPALVVPRYCLKYVSIDALERTLIGTNNKCQVIDWNTGSTACANNRPRWSRTHMREPGREREGRTAA